MNSVAESGGARSTTRARSSTGRLTRYSGAASDSTEPGIESGGGAWYSADMVLASTGPAVLRTYTPGVTVNRPAAAREGPALPAVTGCTANEAPRSGSSSVMGQARLIARVTIFSGLGGSNGSRTGTASGYTSRRQTPGRTLSRK